MTEETSGPKHVSDYERALCYYTLPRVVSPVTFGLIIAYAACFFEAVAVLCIGFVLGNATWTTAGMVALSAIVVFGMLIFTTRALMNDVRKRQALAEAEGVPDAATQNADCPDPFGEHVLLRYVVHEAGSIYRCDAHCAALAYRVERGAHGRSWELTEGDGKDVCRAMSMKRGGSFSLNSGSPSKMVVFQGEREVARIRRAFSFTAPRTEISCQEPKMRQYSVRNGSIFLVLAEELGAKGEGNIPWKGVSRRGERLVGRIYELRSFLYLDIETEYFDDPILAYYTTLF